MFYRIIASLCLALLPLALFAQSGRVYDDQKMDVAEENVQWYETPFFWVGVIVIVLIVGYGIYRRQQKKESNPLKQ